mmetsp:Transcript_139658/g.243081  ORF Transcript_139658/g.243081 Transcript_139658/m.243081 type:complete len:357 (+) Transcript_139658:780-1850(+)
MKLRDGEDAASAFPGAAGALAKSSPSESLSCAVDPSDWNQMAVLAAPDMALKKEVLAVSLASAAFSLSCICSASAEAFSSAVLNVVSAVLAAFSAVSESFCCVCVRVGSKSSCTFFTVAWNFVAPSVARRCTSSAPWLRACSMRALTLSASLEKSDLERSSLSFFPPSTTLLKPQDHMFFADLKPFCILPIGKASDSIFCMPLSSSSSCEAEADPVLASAVVEASAAAAFAVQKSSTGAAASMGLGLMPSVRSAMSVMSASSGDDGGELMSNSVTAAPAWAVAADAEAPVTSAVGAPPAVSVETAAFAPSVVSRASLPSSCNIPSSHPAPQVGRAKPGKLGVLPCATEWHVASFLT